MRHRGRLSVGPARALAVGLAIVLALVAGRAEAVSLADLFAGGTITAGDKAFFDWTLNEGSSPAIDLSAIDVTPLTDPSLNPGLLFTASDDALSLVGPGFLDLEFRYTVTAPAALIKDASVGLTGFTRSGDGSVGIFQDILDIDEAPIDSNLVFANPGGEQLTDSAEFALRQAVIIATAVDVVAGEEGQAGIVTFEQRVSQVPLPATLALLLPALATLAGLGWQSRRRARATA